jgi:hypothetical protein
VVSNGIAIVFRLTRLLADKGKFVVKFRADIGQTTSKKGQTASKKGQNSGKVATNLHISQKSINFAAQMKKA